MLPDSRPPRLIACIVGARPNFMKVAPILKQLKRFPEFEARLIHTGQHFSPEMSDSFFRDLSLPQPDEYLGIASGTQTAQTAAMLLRFEQSFLSQRPDLVLVVGDVTSTLAATLTASKMNIRVAHVEAGLRSFDRRMPEELNRIVTDTLSDFLFVSEPSGVANLRREGAPADRVFFVGNVMIDTLMSYQASAQRSRILEDLGVQRGQYALATLHRPGNVDDPAQLRQMTQLLNDIGERLPVVFPVHPRTAKAMQEAGLAPHGVILTKPQGYIDFLSLMTDARFVLTDSGGIQEETTILQVPCLTLRDNTERPVTIELGTNQLVGTDTVKAAAMAREILDHPPAHGKVPELWDGHASERIVQVLRERIV
jgi:UDP-N-acetylglucosamine 2-epimerase (non-hydrolysing)